MDNRKIFIGNLDFNITENELKRFLSGYGSVVNLKLYQKKGYAFAEMSTDEEASAAVKKLDGFNFKNREIRASLVIKKNKAKSATARRFREKGAAFAAKKRAEEAAGKKRNEESRGSSRSKPGERGRGFSSSGSRPGTGYKSGNSRSSGYTGRSEEGTDERRSGSRFERDSRDRDGVSGSGRPERKGWAGKPAYSSKSSRYGKDAGEEYREDSGRRYERKNLSSGGGYPGGFKREKGGSAGAQVRVWTASKPAGSKRREDAPERERPERRTDFSDRGDSGDSSQRMSRTQGGRNHSSNRSGTSSGSYRGGTGRRNVSNPSGGKTRGASGDRRPKGRPGRG
jgi:RNA recognition motif-containing protein